MNKDLICDVASKIRRYDRVANRGLLNGRQRELLSDPEGSRGANDPSSQTQAALDNKHNMEQREQYYATVRKPGQQSPCREVSALERIPEYSEDIYPYATFNLPEQENLSANPMRQAFFYERSETMLQGAQVRSLLASLADSSCDLLLSVQRSSTDETPVFAGIR
jgi:hypothetical protein